MLNLDPEKLLILAIVAVLVLGPNKLPQAARQAGAAWRSFTQFRHRMEAEVRGQMPDLPSSAEIARLARSPSALLNRLSAMDSKDSANGSNGHVDATEPEVAAAPIPPVPTTSATPSALPDEIVTYGDPGLN